VSESALLEVDSLEVVYHTIAGSLPALHDVGFEVRHQQILGIVGESGCGKTTVSGALMGLLPANGEITAGRVDLNGRNLLELSASELRKVRGGEMAMIFQDPLTSLNPTFRIGRQLVDAQLAHAQGRRRMRDRELRRRTIAMLSQVGIPDAEERLGYYPHQFSGGMRQRIMIAMALLLEPSLLIADEPTSALDVTLEAQIVELLERLRRERGTAIIFISHDLGVVSQLCDRVLVMYAGEAVEEADVHSLFAQPLHPYTQALLAAVPSRRQRGERLTSIPGRVPSLSGLPAGCRFAPRCQFAQPVNDEHPPAFLSVDDRRIRCNMYDPTSGYEPVALPEKVG
jgi:oligopeptide/dipeptide ABC transporter ATP-binding protein